MPWAANSTQYPKECSTCTCLGFNVVSCMEIVFFKWLNTYTYVIVFFVYKDLSMKQKDYLELVTVELHVMPSHPNKSQKEILWSYPGQWHCSLSWHHQNRWPMWARRFRCPSCRPSWPWPRSFPPRSWGPYGHYQWPYYHWESRWSLGLGQPQK